MNSDTWKVIADGRQIGQYVKRGRAVVQARLARRRGAKAVDIVPGVSARADMEDSDGVRQQQQDA